MTKNKEKKSRNIFLAIGFILMLVYTISFLVPVVWAIITSTKTELDFMTNIFGWPKKMGKNYTFYNNYVFAYNNMKVGVKGIGNIYIVEMFYNAICYSVTSTIMHTLPPCIAAYAGAKYNFKFGKVMYTIVIVTMILPIVGNMASSIQMAKWVGVYDTFWGIAIMKGSFLGTNFLIFYAAFKSLPNDFKEAAELDGASQLHILLFIILPLVKTTISAIALLSFIGYWNDYSTALIYMPSKPTIAYGLYAFTHTSSNEASFVTVRVAACMMVTLPIFIVFVLFKDKLVGNMAVGGIKG
ncbi:MAG: carbohydrate ABC transporter permease [Clostridia bacterium]|nr:carbohydrate ABC transporter permease [Clostridia bacterium]